MRQRSGCYYKVMLSIEGQWVPLFHEGTGKPIIKKTEKEALAAVKKASPGFFSLDSGKYVQYPFEIVETCWKIEEMRHTQMRTVHKG